MAIAAAQEVQSLDRVLGRLATTSEDDLQKVTSVCSWLAALAKCEKLPVPLSAQSCLLHHAPGLCCCVPKSFAGASRVVLR